MQTWLQFDAVAGLQKSLHKLGSSNPEIIRLPPTWKISVKVTSNSLFRTPITLSHFF